MKILLIGYGNPGRLDDGLGPMLAEEIEKLNIGDVTVDSDYQLTVEDAAEVAEHDAVIFADASVDGVEPYFLKEVKPGETMSFSSHSCEPEAVLGLCRDMFSKNVPGYAFGIRGYEFNEFGQRLSVKAQHNLDEAITFMAEVLRTKNIQAT